MSAPSRLDVALQYAELGYRVFPCIPNTKHPITLHGFKDAGTQPVRIERWWTNQPNANIGIPAEGLLVVDIDGAGNTWPGEPDQSASLAEAGAIALTPRGGRHYIFRRPADKAWRCSAGVLAPGVDIRTDGGYIVAAPSVTEDGEYRWVEGCELSDPAERLPEPPAWLVEQLDRLATVSPQTPTDATTPGDANTIPAGQRNATLARLAGHMRRVGMGQKELTAALRETNNTRCVPPLAETEVDRIAASIARYRPDEVSVALAENHYSQMYHHAAVNAGAPDPGPFPEALLNIPGFIGEVMAYTNATNHRHQPVMAMAGALALLGALTGRKVCDDVNTRTNVYCIGVCRTGGGKERPRQVNKEILFHSGAEKLAGPEGMASHAGIVSAVELHPSILFQIDEAGRLLRTLAEPGRSPHLYHVVTNLMKLFTSSSSVYLGDAYADPSRNKVIHQPNLCLWGTTVAQSLYESFTSENITDGFLSRVMIFEAPTKMPPKKKPQKLALPPSVLEAAKYWFDFQPSGNLSQEHPMPLVIEASPDADSLFDALDVEADAVLEEIGDPLGSLWTRTTEKARKLALLYACSRDRELPRIDEAAARWACDLSRYLTKRLVFLAGRWVAENPFDSKRKRILRLITDAGECGLTRSELYAKTRAFTTRERADLLEALQLCGDVRVHPEPAGPNGGAPRIRYVAAQYAGG